ncbi:MAG: hypothetical protein ABIR91_00435 [Candidatus Saccharimonadales bacterium]
MLANTADRHFKISIVRSAMPCSSDLVMLRQQLESELGIVKNLEFVDSTTYVEMHFDAVDGDQTDAAVQCVIEAVRKCHSDIKDIRYQGISVS